MPLPPVKHRRLRPERMDDPSLDAAEHARALAGLGRLNSASRATASVWAAVRSVTGVVSGERLRVLDVASGGGDLAIGLWRAAERDGVNVEVTGIDFSPTAVEIASRATPRGACVRFEVRDALAEPLPACDVAVSSLFLHHLTESQTMRTLAAMSAAAPAVVVSDLRRSLAGYMLAHAACRVLSRSPVVHFDGPRSVEGAYTAEELRGIAAEAGLTGASVQLAWPQRLMLTWCRPETDA